MTIGTAKAYALGIQAYKDGRNYGDCPESLTDIERELWQLGFDQEVDKDAYLNFEIEDL